MSEERSPFSAPTGLREEDLPGLVRVFTEPVVRAYLGGPVEEEVARTRAAEYLARGAEAGIWAIRNEEGVFAGVLWLDRHHEGLEWEVSYSLLPEHQGRGLATAGLRWLLGHAFTQLGLGRVIAETQVANVRSVRLLERVGMLPERRLLRFGAEQVIYGIDVTRFLGKV